MLVHSQVLLEELDPVVLGGELAGDVLHHHLVGSPLADWRLHVAEAGALHLSNCKLQKYNYN